MSTAEAIGVLVAIGIWSTLVVFIGVGIGHWISRRNRRR